MSGRSRHRRTGAGRFCRWRAPRRRRRASSRPRFRRARGRRVVQIHVAVAAEERAPVGQRRDGGKFADPAALHDRGGIRFDLEYGSARFFGAYDFVAVEAFKYVPGIGVDVVKFGGFGQGFYPVRGWFPEGRDARVGGCRQRGAERGCEYEFFHLPPTIFFGEPI